MPPLLRPSLLLGSSTSTAAAATRALSCTLSSSRSKAKCQSLFLSTSATRRASTEHAHEEHFDAPGGWLFGVKPGEKYEKEGWETIWYWGFFGSLGLGVVAYCFKPDTSIQTWALEEARRRLEKEGILEEPKN